MAPVTSPGPLHPGQPAGRQGEDCLLSMPILRHSILQQGTMRKTAAPRWAPANPACFAGAGPGLSLLMLSVADASLGTPHSPNPTFRWRCLARKRRSDMASSTRQRQEMQLSCDQSVRERGGARKTITLRSQLCFIVLETNVPFVCTYVMSGLSVIISTISLHCHLWRQTRSGCPHTL